MQRWYDISSNPNAPEVIQARRSALNSARVGALINSRVNYLCSLVKEKNVLDIGVVEHTIEAVNNPEWLHKHLCQSAKTCLGVDILEEEVHKLRSFGFNVICTDVVKEPLEQKFDVIICGEVIEHLDSPGHLLESAVKMLAPEGKLVLSVPHPWYINVTLKNLFNGVPYIDNADHVSWFDPCTLYEMSQRHGLVLARFGGIAVHHSSNLLTRVFFSLTPLFISLGLRPEVFAKTMIYEFVLADNKYEQAPVAD